MIYIGNHISSSGGFAQMGRHAIELGANTFAFFTRNPRGGKAKEIDPDDTLELQRILVENHFGPLVAHAPYTMNLCSSKESVLEFSRNVLKEDLLRMEFLPDNYYNFHPGSHVGLGVETGIDLIASALNDAMFSDMKTTVLLETMAGKGSEIGSTFEELRSILEKCIYPERIGICLDTCHVWDAGYNISLELDEILSEFDNVIGIDKLKALHLNNSKNPMGSHKDRHEKLCDGHLGAEVLENIIKHPLLQGKPFILETPNDDDGYRNEIAWVKGRIVYES